MAEILNLNLNASITCHAWNKDKTQIALAQNSKEVYIFIKNGNNWTQTQVLNEHTSKVLSIDWAPNSNRIVTCGADKNANVWSLDAKSGLWKPELVVLRINRSANCVKWSPNEKKFAVGCGHRCICVCYYETNQCFWVAKHLKKQIKSSTLCLDWHPNSVLLAAGGTDFKCRIFYAYVPDVDGQAPDTLPWGKNLSPSDCVAEFQASNHGWIYSCSFNFSGNILGFVGHDSTIYMVDASQNPKNVISLPTPNLPFTCFKFLTDTKAIAAGHDCYPVVFGINGNTIKLIQKLDISNNKQVTGATSAMDMFNRLDRVRQDTNTSTINTMHQNSIKQISIYKQENSGVSQVTTSGLDGLIVLWNLAVI